MKRQGLAFIACAALAAGAWGCFDDPTESLRGGPSYLQLSRTSLVLSTGESLAVQATLRDDQGNVLPITGASFSPADPSIADVAGTSNGPGDAFAQAYIKAVSAQGGVTSVTVTSRSASANVRVVVLPGASPSGTFSVTGTARTDTVGIAPNTVAISAGDTLVFSSTAQFEFDTTAANASAVRFGTVPAYIISRTPTAIKAMARGAYAGPATVTNLRFLGTAETGVIVIGSLDTDSLAIAKARFRGPVTVVNSSFGTSTQLTIDAPTGMTFNTTAGATQTGVFLGSAAATVVTRTATQITAISTSPYTGGVRLTNVNLGTVRLDSLYTPANVTMNASNFPGTISTNGNLLDTITVRGGGIATFTTSGAGASNVIIGTDTAFVIARFTDSLKVIARKGANTSATITNVTVAGNAIPSLATANVSVSNVTTGELNEPGNQSSGTATVLNLTGTSAANPLIIYGAMNDVTDARDYYTATLAASAAVGVEISWFGDGTGNDTDNPDFDVVVCSALSGTGTCSYGQDAISPINSASGLSQPETGTTATLAAAQIWIRTFAYVSTNNVTYRLKVWLQ